MRSGFLLMFLSFRFCDDLGGFRDVELETAHAVRFEK